MTVCAETGLRTCYSLFPTGTYLFRFKISAESQPTVVIKKTETLFFLRPKSYESNPDWICYQPVKFGETIP